jgi:hypothetical protein
MMTASTSEICHMFRCRSAPFRSVVEIRCLRMTCVRGLPRNAIISGGELRARSRVGPKCDEICELAYQRVMLADTYLKN